MAEKRSLAALRAQREALIRSMEQNRVQVSAALRQVSAQVPELPAVAAWIGDHPALSMLGAFAGGMMVPALLTPAPAAVRSPGLLELLAPLLQDSLRSAVALFAQGAMSPPPPPGTSLEPLPAPGVPAPAATRRGPLSA
jgi:hypothetical protein